MEIPVLSPALRHLFGIPGFAAEEPCRHPHLIFDTYRGVITATCTCGEMWVSEDGLFDIDGQAVCGHA